MALHMGESQTDYIGDTILAASDTEIEDSRQQCGNPEARIRYTGVDEPGSMVYFPFMEGHRRKRDIDDIDYLGLR
jgi:hypothetical protein